MTRSAVALLVLFTAAAGRASAGPDIPGPAPSLPPVRGWSGRSETIVTQAGDPWITLAEESGFRKTPRYDETIAWIRRLATAAPEVKLVSLGKSPEQRDIWMVVVSRARATTPDALRRSGKPTLLVQAGIHAGEIDGKDAGLMLLRDLTVRGFRRRLLDSVNLLFIPIYNVDGHERFHGYTRINQRGPDEAGWRATARNLNLNRDYSKLDAPETRLLVRALQEWQPDLYLDLHVTDGADYQYDITYGWNGPRGWSPAIAGWLDGVLRPGLDKDLADWDHIPGPLVWHADENDPDKGLFTGIAGPRLSNGYGDARHLPTVLVENHSLKPYRQRVLGTYVLLISAMRVLGEEAPKLREAVAADRARRGPELALDWKPDPTPGRTELAGVSWMRVPSRVSGRERVEYTGKKQAFTLPVVSATVPAASASRPRAYWVPAAWGDVIERLALHGIQMERIEEPREVQVEMYRLGEAKIGEPFEGHVPVTAPVTVEHRPQRFAAGSVRVPTDQPLGDLAMLLLEPQSPDSFFRWGFFLEVLQRTEYVEAYVMEPMAEAMLAAAPRLAAEFEQKLEEDPAFAADPNARLQWFYSRSPYFDERWRLYPVARER